MATKRLLLWIMLLPVCALSAAEYTYVMTDYTAPSFTTTDNRFELKCAKGSGISAPQAGATDKFGDKDMRYYAGNTLTITSLGEGNITRITFAISRNGHASLTQPTVSTGAMEATPDYITQDGHRAWEYSWNGCAHSITFTIGELCTYGYECTENNKYDAGTLFFKAITITTDETSAVEQTPATRFEMFAADGHLNIIGVADGTMVHIYDITGAYVLSAPLVNGRVPIATLHRGIYLVRTDNHTRKLMIK